MIGRLIQPPQVHSGLGDAPPSGFEAPRDYAICRVGSGVDTAMALGQYAREDGCDCPRRPPRPAQVDALRVAIPVNPQGRDTPKPAELGTPITTDITTIKLLPEYDVARLEKDLAALSGDCFRRKSKIRQGRVIDSGVDGWRVLSLRSPGGDPTRTDPGGMGLSEYLDTPALDETPYIASVLRALPLPLRAVRLMSLAPGEAVGEHSDPGWGLRTGGVRLHLPIVTNEDAVLVFEGNEHRWQPGELWYADFDRPHSVHNHGRQTRVHLVIDCYVVEAFLGLIPPRVLAHMDTADVVFHRMQQPVSSATLDTLAGPISVPPAFLLTSKTPQDQRDAQTAPDHTGVLRVLDERLVLIAGERQIALVHIGSLEFRLLGGTEARTIKFVLRDGVRKIRYRSRLGSDQWDVERDARGPLPRLE